MPEKIKTEKVSLTTEETGHLCHLLALELARLRRTKTESNLASLAHEAAVRALASAYAKISAANEKLMGHGER